MTPSSDLPAGASGDSEDAAGDGVTPLPDEAIVPGSAPAALPVPAARKRPRPGERRVQILETLATMLQEPGAERVTTAALAAKLEVSEAALYRHFASKAQMFEGLIEFIEQSVFTLVNQIVERETDARVQVQKVLAVLLQFGEKNPGMTRVMVGDALVFENDRLTARMNQFFERIESQLRQSLRQLAEGAGSQTPTVDAQRAGVGADRVRDRPPAALRPLRIQEEPDRAPRRRAAPVRGLTRRRGARRDDDDPGRRPAAHAAAPRRPRSSPPAARCSSPMRTSARRSAFAPSACRCRAARRARRWRRCRR